MSTFSFSESSSQKTKRGFSEKDVSSFLQQGATLASRDKGQGAITAPGEKTRTTTTSKSQAGGVASTLGAKDRGTQVKESGFMGKFSDLSKEKIESLAASFKQREQNIAQRRSQPGRSSLFMGR